MSSRGEDSWVNPHFAVTAPQPRPSSPLQPVLTALTQSCEAEGFQVEGLGFFRPFLRSPGMLDRKVQARGFLGVDCLYTAAES